MHRDTGLLFLSLFSFLNNENCKKLVRVSGHNYNLENFAFLTMQKDEKLGVSLLRDACEHGIIRIVNTLLPFVTDINIVVDENDLTFLHYASHDGHIEIVKLLLTRPEINIVAEDPDGKTPIDYAVANDNAEIVKLLLIRLELVQRTCTETYVKTALHYACQYLCLDLVTLFLKQPNVNVNANDGFYGTPLHYLMVNHWNWDRLTEEVHGSHDIILNLLLNRPEIKINELDSENNTPLHYAVQSNFYDSVKILLNRPEIKINERNDYGETPLQLAIKLNYTEIIKLFADRGELSDDGTGTLLL